MWRGSSRGISFRGFAMRQMLLGDWMEMDNADVRNLSSSFNDASPRKKHSRCWQDYVNDLKPEISSV